MGIKKTINTLIVEDHDFASHGIIEVLKNHEFHEFPITEARNADEAFDKIEENDFDLILLDLILKNENENVRFTGGDDLLRYVKKNLGYIKVIILSKVDSVEMLDYIINVLGADGYILKSDKSIAEVLEGIKDVFNGRRYISPSLDKQFRYYESVLDLDYRDKAILNGLSQGGSHKDIASELESKGVSITKSAIEKRIRNLKQRLRAKTTGELMVKAMQLGIIS